MHCVLSIQMAVVMDRILNHMFNCDYVLLLKSQ